MKNKTQLENIRNLISEIGDWIRDFEKTQPRNIEIDYDTFEGSAYLLFSRVINTLNNSYNKLKIINYEE